MAIQINETSIPTAWTKILDDVDWTRRGELRGPEHNPILVEIAFSATPAADGEIMELNNKPIPFKLPAYKELWARVAGGGAGTTELHGILWDSDGRSESV